MIPSKEWFCWLLDSQSIYLSHAFSVNSHGVSFLNKLYTTIFHHYNALKLFLTNVAHTTHHQSPWDPTVYFPYPSLSSKTASLFSASCPTTFRFFWVCVSPPNLAGTCVKRWMLFLSWPKTSGSVNGIGVKGCKVDLTLENQCNSQY